MTKEQILKQIEDEGKRLHIENMIETLGRNIFDALGGEESLHPFHKANIQGALTYLKTYSLKPLEQTNGDEETSRTDRKLEADRRAEGNEG